MKRLRNHGRRSMTMVAGCIVGLVTMATAAATDSQGGGSQPGTVQRLLGVYKVYNDTLTNQIMHEDAEFMVFRTGPTGNARYGLVFQQAKSNKGDAMNCADAAVSADKKVLSCAQVGQLEPKVLEVLTVASTDSTFCKDLAGSSGRPKIKNCPKQSKCACFNLQHYCYDKSKKAYEECLSKKTRATMPPGSGAGSGGQH